MDEASSTSLPTLRQPLARTRVAIIGAGVMGLGIGWRLARAGCIVDLFDSGEAGRGASWAAAGMLAAGLEAEPGEERLFQLNRASQVLWPGFARELEGASGIELGYRNEGTLMVAHTRDAVAELQHQLSFQQRLGVRLEWLEAREVKRREPYLTPSTLGAIWSPEDHQIDNRALVEALRLAFISAAGRLHERSAIRAIEIGDRRVHGLRLDDHRVEADIVVLAAGAWSRNIEGLPDTVRLPVRPVKGQMLALRFDPNTILLRHVLWAPKVYLVPRRSGRLVIGGTVEERGFDPALTAGGVMSLLEAAWRALPAIEELPIEELWTGFRPGSRDDAPILGPCEIEGLVLATGHHRNGILLAPVTVDAMSRFILTGELDPMIGGFSLARFASARTAMATTTEELS